MLRIGVLGANGQLGSDLCKPRSGYYIDAVTHSMLDITDAAAVDTMIRLSPWEVVINAAAFNGPCQCEEYPVRAWAINALACRYLARACAHQKIPLVHISTDYVFNGVQRVPYVEESIPNPLNVYGMTKWDGEKFIQLETDRYYIVRTTGLYGKVPCRGKGNKNFVTEILAEAGKPEVRVRSDLVCTPTSTANLADQIYHIIEFCAPGTYHATNEGYCTWLEFARAVYKIKGITTPVNVALDVQDTVIRPHYTVLENDRLNRQGRNIMKHWLEALTEFMESIP